MTERIALASCLVLIASGTALACPVCDTGTGQQVRSGIFDGNFARTLVTIVLPFPILLACVALIHFGWPAGRGSATAERHRRDP